LVITTCTPDNNTFPFSGSYCTRSPREPSSLRRSSASFLVAYHRFGIDSAGAQPSGTDARGRACATMHNRARLPSSDLEIGLPVWGIGGRAFARFPTEILGSSRASTESPRDRLDYRPSARSGGCPMRQPELRQAQSTSFDDVQLDVVNICRNSRREVTSSFRNITLRATQF
jgi:hypothetical protein